MILNTDVEYIVEQIKSGKKDLFDAIKEYMILADSIDDQIEKVSNELETLYGHQIEDLDNEISDLEDTIEEQDKKIDKLESKIEELEADIKHCHEFHI